LCCIEGGWLTYDAAHALIICGCYLLVGMVLKLQIRHLDHPLLLQQCALPAVSTQQQARRQQKLQ
jgi:hypothetical protein